LIKKSIELNQPNINNNTELNNNNNMNTSCNNRTHNSNNNYSQETPNNMNNVPDDFKLSNYNNNNIQSNIEAQIQDFLNNQILEFQSNNKKCQQNNTLVDTYSTSTSTSTKTSSLSNNSTYSSFTSPPKSIYQLWKTK
jgi:hypothetical protein